MKLVTSLALSSLFMSGAHAASNYVVYKATITPIPGVDTSVSGSVVVFADRMDGTTVGYGGHVTGLQANLDATNCPATNGCGVHIHSGMGCEDSAAQGGHYFADPVTSDPWVTAQYSSDAEGMTTFASSVEMGTIDLEGHAFVVHAEDGSRVGCGLLEMVSAEEYLTADLVSLGDSMATGSVTALPVDTMICYMGYGRNLEASLSAFYAASAGPDCTATNGCGTHVHAGTDCTSTETQMGHYYTGDSDPWAIVGYESTSTDGSATYTGCVNTGEAACDGKAFILHANNGSRVACGLLGSPVDNDPPRPLYFAYHATITPIPGVTTQVSGEVVVFANAADGTTVGYGGHVSGLETNLDATNCPATNGCGVHIHSGMGCEDTAAQGGHYFADPVMTDPWITARYSSNAEGMATFASSVEMGTVDLEGHVFVVHAEDGSRVGCGVLTMAKSFLQAQLDSFGDSSMVSGSVVAMPIGAQDICYMGYAMNLEASLNAFYSASAGPDCTATNGCGTHVHAGTSCESTTTQMGHYYEGDSDPWAIVGYHSTSAGGYATFVDCVQTGVQEYLGRAFVVHNNAGGRVACGTFVGLAPIDDSDSPTDSPVSDSPTDSPVDDSPTDSPVDDSPTDSPVDDSPTNSPVAAPTGDTASAGSAASMVLALVTSVVGLWASLDWTK